MYEASSKMRGYPSKDDILGMLLPKQSARLRTFNLEIPMGAVLEGEGRKRITTPGIVEGDEFRRSAGNRFPEPVAQLDGRPRYARRQHSRSATGDGTTLQSLLWDALRSDSLNKTRRLSSVGVARLPNAVDLGSYFPDVCELLLEVCLRLSIRYHKLALERMLR